MRYFGFVGTCGPGFRASNQQGGWPEPQRMTFPGAFRGENTGKAVVQVA